MKDVSMKDVLCIIIEKNIKEFIGEVTEEQEFRAAVPGGNRIPRTEEPIPTLLNTNA
jgi:hypothetical protein